MIAPRARWLEWMRREVVRPGGTRGDPFERWDQNRSRGHTAEAELIAGLVAWYAGEDATARKILHGAVQVADRALEDPGDSGGDEDFDIEESFNSLFVAGVDLQDLAVGIRAGAYAYALLGEPLDTHSLRMAADDLDDWVGQVEGVSWNAQFQAYHLAAVRLNLMAGRVEMAKAQLECRSRHHEHAEESAFLRALVAPSPTHRQDLLGAGLALLAPLCEPDYLPRQYQETEILRLELAALIDRYVLGGDGDLVAAAGRIVEGFGP